MAYSSDPVGGGPPQRLTPKQVVQAGGGFALPPAVRAPWEDWSQAAGGFFDSLGIRPVEQTLADPRYSGYANLGDMLLSLGRGAVTGTLDDKQAYQNAWDLEQAGLGTPDSRAELQDIASSNIAGNVPARVIPIGKGGTLFTEADIAPNLVKRVGPGFQSWVDDLVKDAYLRHYVDTGDAPLSEGLLNAAKAVGDPMAAKRLREIGNYHSGRDGDLMGNFYQPAGALSHVGKGGEVGQTALHELYHNRWLQQIGNSKRAGTGKQYGEAEKAAEDLLAYYKYSGAPDYLAGNVADNIGEIIAELGSRRQMGHNYLPSPGPASVPGPNWESPRIGAAVDQTVPQWVNSQLDVIDQFLGAPAWQQAQQQSGGLLQSLKNLFSRG